MKQNLLNVDVLYGNKYIHVFSFMVLVGEFRKCSILETFKHLCIWNIWRIQRYNMNGFMLDFLEPFLSQQKYRNFVDDDCFTFFSKFQLPTCPYCSTTKEAASFNNSIISC